MYGKNRRVPLQELNVNSLYNMERGGAHQTVSPASKESSSIFHFDQDLMVFDNEELKLAEFEKRTLKIQKMDMIQEQLRELFKVIHDSFENLELQALFDSCSKFALLYMEKQGTEMECFFKAAQFEEHISRIIRRTGQKNYMKDWFTDYHAFDMFVYREFTRMKDQLIITLAENEEPSDLGEPEEDEDNAHMEGDKFEGEKVEVTN
jgi:hypothetical protein